MRAWFGTFGLMLLGAFASAQRLELPAHKTSTPPTIDGDLSDPIWQSAPKVGPFVDPYNASNKPDPAHAWVAYDAQAIYVAFQFFESRMDQLVAREVVPGSKMESDDRATFLVDCFNSRAESGISSFTVNPIGTQTERIAGGRAAKREWRGEWHSAVKRHADSWTVEMRIPWRILSYGNGGPRDMAINFHRHQGRTSTVTEWSNRGPSRRADYDGFWRGVEPPPTLASKLELMPYLAPEWNDGSTEIRAGLDARYRFTDRLTSVVSIKPDFRNIEGQIAGIDFSRSERFLEDVRPFFTEGGTFFDMTPQFSFARMFYSRRIEEFDAGAKVFGFLTDKVRLGALATYDQDRQDGAFRVAQSLGPRGGMSLFGTGTNRRGRSNTALGGAFSNYWGNYGFNTQLATVNDRGRQTDAGAYAFTYSVPRLFHETRFSWVDPGFNPSLALVPYDDRKGHYNYFEHNNNYRSGPLKQMHAELYIERYRHYDGSPEAEGYSAGTSFVTRGDLGIEVYYNDFEFEEVLDRTWWIELTANASNRFRRYGVSFEHGERENEQTNYLQLTATQRILKKVDVGLTRAVLDFQGKTKQTIATLAWEINPARSLSGRFVELDGRKNWYVAYRNAGFSGTEVFVILGDPNALSFRKRLSVKLVWAF